MLAVERAALKIANSVSRENPDVNSVAPWKHMVDHLFNTTQRRAKKSTFVTIP